MVIFWLDEPSTWPGWIQQSSFFLCVCVKLASDDASITIASFEQFRKYLWKACPEHAVTVIPIYPCFNFVSYKNKNTWGWGVETHKLSVFTVTTANAYMHNCAHERASLPEKWIYNTQLFFSCCCWTMEQCDAVLEFNSVTTLRFQTCCAFPLPSLMEPGVQTTSAIWD